MASNDERRDDGSMTEIEIKVGQIWKDNDKRMYDRRLRVERVDDTYAYVSTKGAMGWTLETTRILKRRMRATATGYKLLSERIS